MHSIFDRFLHDERSREGTGLGLSVAVRDDQITMEEPSVSTVSQDEGQLFILIFRPGGSAVGKVGQSPCEAEPGGNRSMFSMSTMTRRSWISVTRKGCLAGDRVSGYTERSMWC